MNLYNKLIQLGAGMHYCGPRRGHVEIKPSKTQECLNVLWCSGKDHHNAHDGTAVGASVYPNKVENVCYSIINLHMARGDKIDIYLNQLDCHLDNALEYKNNPPGIIKSGLLHLIRALF